MERVHDGGYRGWLVVLSAFVVYILYGGLMKVMGVLAPILQEQFSQNIWLIGWELTMIGGALQISGLLTGPLISVFGERRVFVVSAVMAVIGVLGAFLAPSLLFLTLALVCLTGTGIGIIACLAKAILGRYFNTRLSIAAGISTAGLPLSYMIFPPLAQLLLEVYGWRGTLLITSSLTAFLIPCGLLVRPMAPSSGDNEVDGYRPVMLTTDLQDTTGNNPKGCNCRRALDVLSEKMDLGLFKDLMMWSHIATYCLFGFVNNSWVIFMVPYAQTKGFEPFVATSFSIIAGVTAIIFNILQGVVISKQILSTRWLITFGAAIGCGSLILSAFLNSYVTLAVAMAVYGVSHGILYPGLMCFVIEEQGNQRATNAFGWTGFVSGLFRLCFGFSTGLLYDLTGSYDWTFIFLGSLLGLMVPFFFLDKMRNWCRRK